MRVLDPEQLEDRAVATISASSQQAIANREAFDSVAADYDAANRGNVLLEAMRERSLRLLAAHVPARAHVLDLGCGPGTDFDFLVNQKYRVTAVESAPRMVEQAQKRAVALLPEGTVDVRCLAIEEVDHLAPTLFDAAYSSFGALNCVVDLECVAAKLAACLHPQGVVVASVMGRVCPWEIACFAWKRDVRRLGVRFARDVVAVPLGRETVWTRYYSPSEFERPFTRAGFTRVQLCSLGVLVPPPYMDAFAGRHPRLINFLQALEDDVAGWPGIRGCGDHFLIALRKR